MTQLDQPRLALLVMPDPSVLPDLYESRIFDHRARLAVAGALGPWVTLNLNEGRSLWFGGGPGDLNRRVMTMQAAFGFAVVNVTGPAIISGLAPNTVIEMMAAIRGTLTEVK